MTSPEKPSLGRVGRPSASRPRPEPPAPPPLENETKWLVALHLSVLPIWFLPFVGGLLGPFVLWQMHRGQSGAMDLQGRYILNFQLTMMIVALIFLGPAYLLNAIGKDEGNMMMMFAAPLMLGLRIAMLILALYGVSLANKDQLYRYPYAFPFLK